MTASTRSDLVKLLDSRLSIPNTNLETVQENDYNLIYRYRYKNQNYVVRLSLKKSCEELKFEVKILEHLKKYRLPVPAIYEVDKLGRNPLMIMEFVEGFHITKESVSRTLFLRCSKNAGRVLAKIHVAGIDFKNNSSTATVRPLKEINLALSRKAEINRSFLDGDQFIKDLVWATNFYKETKNSRKTILHNDYRPQNLLFNQSNEVAAVLDFDWAYISSSSIKDVAHSVLEWSMPDNQIVWDMRVIKAFLTGYNSSSIEKIVLDKTLLDWMKFSALSDAATYITRTMQPGKTTRINSYMYEKFKLIKVLRGKL
ncbi:phosphotransferase [Candidatus Saccharibacteria bacterium]|nr:phosphotransferase [Candidatus Saccharibacteria bacterium]